MSDEEKKQKGNASMPTSRKLALGFMIAIPFFVFQLSPSAATDQSGPNEGQRFSMLPFGDSIVLLDSLTGKTWLLSAEDGSALAWKPIPFSPVDADEDSLFGDVHIPYIEEIGGPPSENARPSMRRRND
ncbi:MAG: hypothetical protein AAGE92_07660 [Cyanobacteria bacterium P01_G01_bin.4]